MKRQKTARWLTVLTWLLGGVYTLTVIVSAVYVYRLARDMSATWTGVGINPFQTQVTESDNSYNPQPTPTLVPLVELPDPWDGKSRITILLMGLDYRDWQEGLGYPRTDTMMLATIDPITRSAGMLSIPRDLFVEIPHAGYVHNRINAAYPLGERLKLPGGGPELAMETVEDLLGVEVNYYAVIDFHVFERFIDEIGGIDVLVRQRVKISPIGEMSRWLEAKPYHLDGPAALAYARVRKTEGGDFSRAERQQQVVLAIRDRILGFDMLPILVKKAPELYQEFATGIRTNIALDQIVRMGLLALEIDVDSIQTGVIGPPNMVGFATLPDGRQILRAIPNQIRILRDELFISTSSMRPAAEFNMLP